MFKLSVMDNIEINCPVPTLNMPVTRFYDLQNCSSLESQYKSLQKKWGGGGVLVKTAPCFTSKI